MSASYLRNVPWCLQPICNITISDLDPSVHMSRQQVLDRSPLFDQIIVNLYRPGEGIASHVDLMRFEVHTDSRMCFYLRSAYNTSVGRTKDQKAGCMCGTSGRRHCVGRWMCGITTK